MPLSSFKRSRTEGLPRGSLFPPKEFQLDTLKNVTLVALGIGIGWVTRSYLDWTQFQNMFGC